VESSISSLRVDPSQGSHFFHNITALHIGYLTVDPFHDPREKVDYEYLAAQPAEHEDGDLRHLRFSHEMVTKIAGRNRSGVVLRPGTVNV